MQDCGAGNAGTLRISAHCRLQRDVRAAAVACRTNPAPRGNRARDDCDRSRHGAGRTTPATEPKAISQRFISLSSRLLMASMAPLAVGICLDVYIIARIIAGSRGVAAEVAAFLFGTFLVFWVLMPRAVRRRGDDE